MYDLEIRANGWALVESFALFPDALAALMELSHTAPARITRGGLVLALL